MDRKQLPGVSIIVPFYNQNTVVPRVVNSLIKLDYPTDLLTIILINDGSTDGTFDSLQIYNEIEHVKIISFEVNQGRSAVRNKGITSSDSAVVCFLDGDMVVQEDWLFRLLSVLEDPTVVGVMGDSKLPIDYKANELDKYFYSYYRGARQVGEDKPIHFRWFLFNNTAIKRFALDKTGYFNDVFEGYGGEDTDLAIRFWEAFPDGLRFSGTALAEHHHQRTIKEFCLTMEHYGFTNLPTLLEKYPHHEKMLAGDWISSLKGKLAFNKIVRSIVYVLSLLFPVPVLTRYKVVDSVIRGARKRLKKEKW